MEQPLSASALLKEVTLDRDYAATFKLLPGTFKYRFVPENVEGVDASIEREFACFPKTGVKVKVRGGAKEVFKKKVSPVTSSFGNSSRATSDAEYIDAPSSLTVNIRTLSGSGTRFMNSSVSRLAVPFPIAMTSIPYLSTIPDTA